MLLFRVCLFAAKITISCLISSSSVLFILDLNYDPASSVNGLLAEDDGKSGSRGPASKCFPCACLLHERFLELRDRNRLTTNVKHSQTGYKSKVSNSSNMVNAQAHQSSSQPE